MDEKLDKRSLLVQLENCKLIFQVNEDLFETDQILREKIIQRIAMLEGSIEQLDQGEALRNSLEYNHLLDQANHILHVIKDLIERFLDQDTSTDDNSQGNMMSDTS